MRVCVKREIECKLNIILFHFLLLFSLSHIFSSLLFFLPPSLISFIISSFPSLYKVQLEPEKITINGKEKLCYIIFFPSRKRSPKKTKPAFQILAPIFFFFFFHDLEHLSLEELLDPHPNERTGQSLLFYPTP